ncbi:hybrid sensor histidine kinase/response regulator transcription factor [Lewinella sp. IMCC34183]|uniref:hybrid sensor histidine kinase/response regulator transcription factor n=1 Tax=Lewinella sp. IMCC34183 TaxID=2248762 RepID=UPI0018E4ED76|nr:hybrid sensor histidine kinase/response regulator transcription factor [Lewinella sp. IMCC34183]
MALAWLLLMGAVNLLTAQPYYFKHYEVTEGLSHNTIHCAAQDELGFMWFGTKNGLNRFDGYEFRWFQSDSSATGSLGSNFIECLEIADGRLWVGTDDGLFRGSPRSDTFGPVPSTAGLPILDIAPAPGGEVWVVADQALQRIDPVTGARKGRYDRPDLLPALRVTASAAGSVYLATDRALFRYRPAEDAFEPLGVTFPVDTDYPLQFSALYPLSESSLAVGTVSHGAFLVDLVSRTAVPLTGEAEGRYVRDFLQRGNTLWIGTENGVYLYNLLSGAVQHLQKQTGHQYGLPDNAIYSLFADRDEGVWIGTYFRGISYYSPALAGFRKFVPVPGENSVSGSAVRELRQDEAGRIWVGTEDAGLNRYDPATGQFTHFALQAADAPQPVSNIHGILVRDDEVWVGTFQTGLFVLDAATGAVKRHRMAGAESGLRSNFIYSLYQLRDKTVVALTASGLQRYDAGSDRFVPLEGFSPDFFYTSFLEDSRGGQWAGTYWDGLYHYDPREKRVTTYHAGGTENRLGNDAINGIFEDSHRNLWVATENGLNQIRAENGNVLRFGKADGFPSNVFYSLQEDARGKLWMSTANGLACYHPESGRVDTYGTENGLPSNQFNYNSALTDAAGRMYFGTVRGFVSFDPYDIRFNKQEPPAELVLSDLKLPGAPADEAAAAYRAAQATGRVELPYARSTFSLSFSALDYASPGLTEYQYALSGGQDGWVDLEHAHQIHFTDFRHGTYDLQLRVRRHNSEWSPPIAFLSLRVAPPWWQTGWAYAAYAVLGTTVLLVLLMLYHRYNRARSDQRQRLFEHEKEKELYRAKIEFFTNISHEILTPLTLIQNPVEKALRGTDTSDSLHPTLTMVHRNTTRLVNLVRQLLDFRKMEMEDLSLSFVRTDVTALVGDLLERYALEAEERETTMTFPQVDPVYAYIDAEAFRKIAGNLLENALKYGERRVDLRLEADGELFRFTVSNDGAPIPVAERKNILRPFYRLPEHAARPGTGLGLPLAHALAELHGGTLVLDPDPERGTRFVVTLPLHHRDDFELTPDRVEPDDVLPQVTPPLVAPRPGEPVTTILLVEDNPDLLGFIAKELSDRYAILRASDGVEAIAVLEHHTVQLVVSDVKMPRMDGFTLCATLKSDVKHSHVPVILLTSQNQYTAELTGLERGADAYVTKPFAIEYLQARIRNLLDNRARIVEHFGRTPLAHLQSIAQSPVDEDFTRRLDAVIQENITDPDLNVEALAERMHMSRSTLYRKIKDISGANPNELINLVRLKKAAELLKTRRYKVYEVADMVGYNSATSFGRNFKKQFDVSPGDYAKSDDLVT